MPASTTMYSGPVSSWVLGISKSIAAACTTLTVAEQSSPLCPGWHSHAPATHVPLPEHRLGHAVSHPRPEKPGRHSQLPPVHVPRCEQSRGHGASSWPQSAPAKPESHMQRVDISSHVPWPEQLRGQAPATWEHDEPP